MGAFGLDEGYVRLKATEIGRLLAEGRSLMDISDNEGDDEDGENEEY